MKAGDYVVGQKIVLDCDNNPTVIGSAHRVHDTLVKTLEEIAAERKQQRIDHVVATHQSSFGWRLPKNKMVQRADLVLRYKGVGPIWIFKDHKWVKFKRCLDFHSRDLHVRCVDYNDDIQVFDPDVVTIATQDERTRHIAIIRQKQLCKDVGNLHSKAAELHKQATQLEQRAVNLEKEADRIDRLLKRSDAEMNRRTRQWRQRKLETFVKDNP